MNTSLPEVKTKFVFCRAKKGRR